MARAIIFDCFGVLTADIWKEFCATLPPGPGVQQARDLNRAYDAGFIDRQEFLDGVRQATGQVPKEIENLFSGDVSRNAALLQDIAELKKRFKIGLLSNIASDWIMTDFLTPAEQTLFDCILTSRQAGMAKPDHRIFQLMAGKLDENPDACIMVDDSLSHYTAAQEVGMQAILYQDLEQFRAELRALIG